MSYPIVLASAEAAEGPLVLAAVLLSLVVTYLASKIGGEICARINLPSVLGELVFGVLVGVSALHLVMLPADGITGSDSMLLKLLNQSTPMASETLNSVFRSQGEVISVLSELGVIILLFEIGLESQLKELLRVGPQAAVVACVGVAAPFIAGTAGLIAIFHVATVPAIFAGAALTATSIGITARVLAELNRLSSSEGQIIIGAAVLDDVLGIIVLAIVASLAKTGEVELSKVAILIVSAGVFLVGAIVLGRWLSPLLMKLVSEMRTRGQVLITALIFAFLLSYVANVIQLEAILGAFAAGLILAETERQEELIEQIKPIADMLVPIFFITVGARTDVSVLNPFNPANREGLIISAFLIVVAILGKVITGWTVFGKEKLNRLAIGVGMIPRGEVGLVFASVGTASGVLSDALNAAIVVMVILTTFLAPPLLRLVFQNPNEVAAGLPSPVGLAAGGGAELSLLDGQAVEAEPAKKPEEV
ncbi:cation:proton antiporter [Leptolyngbya sp. FACHB-261]|uniref:cation:proton antiporter n=1 Tax=Leptolyngbya sp. FACHB-261 TaxID=2692806 RepID=UPI0028C41D82|nr:cation:proton antiporter [Leptolyngbya sp. FACHB-261]